MKGLVGIAPSGRVTLVSKLYTGLISDSKITEESGILDMDVADNDVVIAHKGICYRWSFVRKGGCQKCQTEYSSIFGKEGPVFRRGSVGNTGNCCRKNTCWTCN